MNNGSKAEKENTPNEANLQEEEVRTLFVSGLPLDIKPRELYLLFRPFKVPFLSFRNRKRRQKVGLSGEGDEMFEKRLFFKVLSEQRRFNNSVLI